MYSLRVYPTKDFVTYFYSSHLVLYAVGIGLGFVFCVLLFWVYNLQVEKRQRKVVNHAVQARTIIDSMFPSLFRERLFCHDHPHDSDAGFFLRAAPPKVCLTTMLNGGNNLVDNSSTTNTSPFGPTHAQDEPIAVIFHNTTVIVINIAGFTAWSSEREPPQVFKLLETLYCTFDSVAKHLSVFKVETTGERYIAVTGLPESSKDHAVVCARFAWEILHQMDHLTKSLEVNLGPGTSNLSLRIGLHSGSVTAGVLRGARGEKTQFQLFGDTMNRAARMESTCLPKYLPRLLAC
jgi:hypothetical protein